jgi:hypothetical protein
MAWIAETLTVLEFLLISLAIGAGAALQGSVGYGMALVASPILIMIEPLLIPGPYMLASQLLSILVVQREWHAIDFGGVKWAIVGRVPGTIAAAVLLALIPKETMVLLFGFLVLGAVAISLTGLHFPPTRWSLLSAGALSGIMGTIATIGGPPMAFVYQDEPGAEIRSTLSGYFIFSASFAVLTLAVVGEFGIRELWLSVTLLPGIAAGYLISSRLLPLLKGNRTKGAVLTVATVSAIVVIVRQLLS